MCVCVVGGGGGARGRGVGAVGSQPRFSTSYAYVKADPSICCALFLHIVAQYANVRTEMPCSVIEQTTFFSDYMILCVFDVPFK